MNIIAGSLRGRVIPFVNRKFDAAEATPQKIKGALFSILGEDLRGRSFLDLYSCSGQIGLEAWSRGADLVVFNEIDPRRFRFIKSLLKEWGVSGNVLLFNMHAFRCLKYLHSKNFRFDCLFLDPPYEKRMEGTAYADLLEEIGRREVLQEEGLIAVQHFGKNVLPERTGPFALAETRRYGSSSLSLYRKGSPVSAG